MFQLKSPLFFDAFLSRTIFYPQKYFLFNGYKALSTWTNVIMVGESEDYAETPPYKFPVTIARVFDDLKREKLVSLDDFIREKVN